MPRTDEEKAQHAAYERGYRLQKRQEREAALVKFGAAATILLRHGYSVGRLTDLLNELRAEEVE